MYMRFFKFTLIISFILVLTNGTVKAQNELDIVTNSWLQYSDAPNAFYHFLSSEAYKMLDARAAKIAQISNLLSYCNERRMCGKPCGIFLDHSLTSLP